MLGLTFKPNTDDMRDSPSLSILPALHEAGATIRAFDPEGMDEARKLMPELDLLRRRLRGDGGRRRAGPDHRMERVPRPRSRRASRSLLRRPLVIDLRNIYKPEEMTEAGLVYHSIGRPPTGEADAAADHRKPRRVAGDCLNKPQPFPRHRMPGSRQMAERGATTEGTTAMMRTVMKRVLVTGGAGFLGSHLCERLRAQGHDVLCVDNYFTGRKDNIAGLLGDPHFEAMRHDVTHPLFVEVDEIYNLACPASPIHYQFDPVQTTKTSVIGAINMLGLAKRLKAKILQTSTSEVYGDPVMHPQPESYRGNVNPIGPRACYDEGKRCAETLFFDYHRQHKVQIRVVRIFNTYGPRMHPNDGRVVSNFIVQALRNEPITLYGDGTPDPRLLLCRRHDRGFVRMMAAPDDITGPINLGNPVETSVAELAELIIELTGSRSKIVHRPLPVDDPVQRCPDISQAKALLDWQPRTALRPGLSARSPISTTCSAYGLRRANP